MKYIRSVARSTSASLHIKEIKRGHIRGDRQRLVAMADATLLYDPPTVEHPAGINSVQKFGQTRRNPVIL